MAARVSILLLFLSMLSSTVLAQRPKADLNQLAAEGAAALQEKRFGEALEMFSAAVAMQPREPSLWLGKGIAAFMLGQNDDAETSLVRALKLNPRSSDASLLLGELQYRTGRVKDAIATYEAALKYAPGEAAFTSRLGQWQKDTQFSDRLYESRGSHFRVLFEGPADEGLARRAVEILEAAYWRVGGALTAYPSGTTTVVLYTLQQFRDFTRAPAWSGGVYDGQIRVPVRGALERPEELERVLAHEFVHAVVAQFGGRNVPFWVNEGLATIFEPQGVRWAEEALGEAQVRVPLERLHQSFRLLPDEHVGTAYAESAVAVQRMMNLRGAGAFMAMLRDLQGGTPFETAFHQRMAMRYDDFRVLVHR